MGCLQLLALCLTQHAMSQQQSAVPMFFTSRNAQASLDTPPRWLSSAFSNNQRAWLLSALFLFGLVRQEVEATLFTPKLARAPSAENQEHFMAQQEHQLFAVGVGLWTPSLSSSVL